VNHSRIASLLRQLADEFDSSTPAPAEIPFELSPPPQPGKRSEEMNWRVEQTWEAHLKEHSAFLQAENGVKPSIEPTLTPDIRENILKSLKLFDGHLLTFDKREQWTKQSKTRAAGIGIYLDPYLTGTSEENDVRNKGKRYLEHWRPWQHQRGKGNPVERLAELYFEARDVRS
jgi:hypothetical protein